MTTLPGSLTTVFVGPSLRPGDVDALRDDARSRGTELDVRPPVCRGDLIEMLDAGHVGGVLMLDGEFGQRLSVSIAEVRAVLEAGLRLHGASSMGVLQAVECRTLSMTGSGWVYQQYLCGNIDSDADVALMYDPDDYEPVTIPLVNVRWLIAEKIRAGEVSGVCGATALRLASEVNFRDRRPSRLAAVWRAGLGSEARPLEPELAEGTATHGTASDWTG